VPVGLRLAGAALVTALLAAAVPFLGGDARSTAAVPACLGVAVTCAALVGHLSFASVRATGDGRMAWIAAGATVAVVGLALTIFAQPTLFPGGGPVAQGPAAGAARYLVWHAALLACGAIALAGWAPEPRRLVIFGGLGALLLVWAAVASAPFGPLASRDGYSFTLRALVGAVVVAQAGVVALWWRRAGRAPTWSDLCVLALLGLSALDAFAFLLASQPYAGAWWASLALRAGQFAVPAVGLLVGFIAVAGKVREFEDELRATLLLDRARMNIRRTEHDRTQLDRLVRGDGVAVALQPIVHLVSGLVVGAEALARFSAGGRAIPPERCFADAHAVGLGVALELTVVQRALAGADRLPDGCYLALNVSPATLEEPDLAAALSRCGTGRPLVVELTEHHPVEDYGALSAALDRLRALGVRVAVDDVGSGFASFRHVTRVNPDILKLDRTLVCGIDDDPVRQSLAAAIVAFAADVGATVVSEGIESESELSCLRDLSVSCGQGFYLARPDFGAVPADAHGRLVAA